jgi:hypothetical protein
VGGRKESGGGKEQEKQVNLKSQVCKWWRSGKRKMFRTQLPIYDYVTLATMLTSWAWVHLNWGNTETLLFTMTELEKDSRTQMSLPLLVSMSWVI